MCSSQLSETLPKKLAMPVFCSDPLSSVAYAIEENLLILSLGGPHFCTLRGTSRPSLSPSCGGDRLLPGDLPGVPERGRRIHCRPRQSRGGGRAAAASALLVDYMLTVAVSVVAGVAAITSAVPEPSRHAVSLSVGFVMLPISRFCRCLRSGAGRGGIRPNTVGVFGWSIWPCWPAWRGLPR
jgi:hypothetical protein